MATEGYTYKDLLEAQQKRLEQEKNCKLIVFSKKNGFPIDVVIPSPKEGVIFPLLSNQDRTVEYSRNLTGKFSNPNFSVVGSSLEGHLCALRPSEIESILIDLSTEAYSTMSQKLGKKTVNGLIDGTTPIDERIIMEGRGAFDVALARARAFRESIERGGYYYLKDDTKYIVDGHRLARSYRYHDFISHVPQIISWEVNPNSEDPEIFEYSQKLAKPIPLPTGFEREYLAGSIMGDPRYRLAGIVSSLSHPLMAVVRNTLARA